MVQSSKWDIICKLFLFYCWYCTSYKWVQYVKFRLWRQRLPLQLERFDEQSKMLRSSFEGTRTELFLLYCSSIGPQRKSPFTQSWKCWHHLKVIQAWDRFWSLENNGKMDKWGQENKEKMGEAVTSTVSIIWRQRDFYQETIVNFVINLERERGFDWPQLKNKTKCMMCV